MSDGIPLCKCGCGSAVTWNKGKRIWNVYIHTHHTTGNYKLGKQWDLGIGSDRNVEDIIREESREKTKDPPLCECGCGIRVTWNDKRVRSQGLFKRWNRYVMGHNTRGISRLDEVKKKISKGLKGRVLSAESRMRFSEAKMGGEEPYVRQGKRADRQQQSDVWAQDIRRAQEANNRNTIGGQAPQLAGRDIEASIFSRLDEDAEGSDKAKR